MTVAGIARFVRIALTADTNDTLANATDVLLTGLIGSDRLQTVHSRITPFST
jgi:hypothetical protein